MKGIHPQSHLLVKIDSDRMHDLSLAYDPPCSDLRLVLETWEKNAWKCEHSFYKKITKKNMQLITLITITKVIITSTLHQAKLFL